MDISKPREMIIRVRTIAAMPLKEILVRSEVILYELKKCSLVKENTAIKNPRKINKLAVVLNLIPIDFILNL